MGKNSKSKKRKFQPTVIESVPELDSFQLDLEITMSTLVRLLDDPEMYASKDCKPLRSIIHKLCGGKGTSPSARISDALREGRWNEAQVLLHDMRERNVVPKLGALQRWVRDCDAAGEHDAQQTKPEIIKTLDAILRTADPTLVDTVNAGKLPEYPIRKHVPWYPAELKVVKTSQAPFSIDESFKDKFNVVYLEKGKDRRPENLHDMILYTSTPNTIDMSKHKLKVERVNIPHLPGAFVLRNVLTKQECESMISAAETIGFTPDVPGGSAKDLVSVLAHNFFWLADVDLVDCIYNRCKDLLPQQMGEGCDIAGLNSRWRLYRYTPGSIYRPHIDGAWPGSGLSKDGEYLYDAYGERWSKLTFLIRLNDNFKGGETTYFTPSADVGYLDAHPICPFQGDVLVFPHGDTQGSYLHEGSAVLNSNGDFYDAKYVIRTEVLYLIPSHVKRMEEAI